MQCCIKATSVAHRDASVAVWRAANEARDQPPSVERIDRVTERVSASDACLVVGYRDGILVGMALAEPWRCNHGAGPLRAGRGHVSMVFVHPDFWGLGVGKSLLRCLHEETHLLGWLRLTVWTGQSNDRARRLYESLRYVTTGRTQVLPGVGLTVQYEHRGVAAGSD